MESLDRATCHDVIRMLDDYVDRELDPKEIERIRRHLEICAACADEVRFEERVSPSSPSPAPPPDPDPDPDPRCARVPRARVAPRRAGQAPGRGLGLEALAEDGNPEMLAIALFDSHGAPVSGDVTSKLVLWDSGTEVNQEPRTPGRPRSDRSQE